MATENKMTEEALRRVRRGSVSLTALTTSLIFTKKAAKARKVVAERRRKTEFGFIDHGENWVWVKDDVEAYLPAAVVEERKDGTVSVEVGIQRELRHVSKEKLGPPITHLPSLKIHVDDMVKMQDVNEATILHNLFLRFKEDLIYTNIGTILVSVNPFKWLDHLFTPEVIAEHQKVEPGELTKPHVFAIANAAYMGGTGPSGADQSIIISGESGSGKTEATKKCLQFFAEAAGSGGLRLEDKLLACNPILEAFGNAKTNRNDNSSRFGKWMEVGFDIKRRICGTRIVNYLLEKSRVVVQSDQERNYHIFYQLCDASSRGQLKELALGPIESYHYTNQSGVYKARTVQDDKEYEDMCSAMKSLDFTDEEAHNLFKMTAAILHLGNVEFKGDQDRCEVAGSKAAQAALANSARLLGVDEALYQKSLEQKLLPTKERTWTPLNVQKAVEARDALAKTLYNHMFDWLVSRINDGMAGTKPHTVIGVLDIFGFEIFKENSFEQLCINFCNEKLQQHFNRHVFKEEVKCYESEQISYDDVKFIDNQDVLDLIEKKRVGLLPMLDDECRVPKGSDVSYLSKVVTKHQSDPRFMPYSNKMKKKHKETSFGVKHYAGTVMYDVTNFREKNIDEILQNHIELLQSSKFSFVHGIMGDALNPITDGSSGKGRKATQSEQFRQSLSDLMKRLNTTFPHYIRCIKSNHEKAQGVLDKQCCLVQLRYAGVFEAVKIRQQGYPFRWPHKVFFTKYRCLGSKSIQVPTGSSSDWKALSKMLLDELIMQEPGFKACKLGRTMVLYRAEPHLMLEQGRERCVRASAQLAQQVWRGHKARKFYQTLLAAYVKLRAAMNTRDLEALQVALKEAKALSFQLFIIREASQLEQRLREEKACREELQRIAPWDPIDHYEEYEAALKEADRLQLTDSFISPLRAKFAAVKDRIETKRNLEKGIELGDKTLILSALKKAEELSKEWGSVVSDEQISQAEKTLEVIRYEEQTLNALRTAVAVGGPSGEVGKFSVQTVSVASLEDALGKCAGANIRTPCGMNLIASAQLLRDLRLALTDAFASDNWTKVRAIVEDAKSREKTDKLSEECRKEVHFVRMELEDRDLRERLVQGLNSGGPQGEVGSLDTSTVRTAPLQAAIADVEKLGGSTGFSVTTRSYIDAANKVMQVRSALLSPDSHSLSKALDEALHAELPPAAKAEIDLIYHDMQNRTIIRQLEEGLLRGSASGVVGAINVAHLDAESLARRITHAAELVPRTMQAKGLLEAAKVVHDIRMAIRNGNWGDVRSLLGRAASLPEHALPQHTKLELTLYKFEAENLFLIDSLQTVIESGGIRGRVGHLDRSKIEISPLNDCLKLAGDLRCRTHTSCWWQDLVLALRDLRQGVKDHDWTNLQRYIAAVRGLNGDSGRDPDLDDVDQDPLLSKVFKWPGLVAHGQEASSSSQHSAPKPMQVPDMVRQEYDLAQLELDNHEILEDVGTALRGAKLEAPLGALTKDSFDPAAHEALVTAVERAQVLVPRTNEAKRAVFTGDLIINMRRHLSVEDWEGIEVDLLRARGESAPGLPALKLPESRPIPQSGAADPNALPEWIYRFSPEGEQEVLRFWHEVQYRRVVRELEEALSSGSVRGAVGALDVSAVRVEGLAAAIDSARHLGRSTERSDHLLACARALWQVRQALKQRDWATVETLLRSIEELVSPSLPSVKSVPQALREEVNLLREEVNNINVIQSLTVALRTGQVQGKVGHLNLRLVEERALKAAITAAVQKGCKTLRAQSLAATASLVRSMRLALVAGQWEKLGQLLQYAAEALSKPGETSASRGEFAIIGDDGFDAKKVGIAREAHEEIRLIQSELDNRNIIVRLTQVLSAGSARGTVGHLDPNSINIDDLDRAISYARHIGCQTMEAQQMLITAQIVRRMRAALQAGDWTELESVLTEAHGKVLSDVVAQEIGSAQDELDNRAILASLSESMLMGQTTGYPGKLHLDAVDLATLNKAIGQAARVGAQSPEAKQMLFTAKVVLRLRQAILAGNYKEAHLTLEAIRGQRLASIAMDEIHLIQDEIDNWRVVTDLTQALSSDSILGTVGAIDLSDVDVGPLTVALGRAEDLGIKTKAAEELVVSAMIVKKLREACQSSDWDAVKQILEDNAGIPISEAAKEEVELVRQEVDCRDALETLNSALQAGGATGKVGKLITRDIEVRGLEKALMQAMELEARTKDINSLVGAAEIIRSLRLALRDQHWDQVDKVLAEARDRVEILPMEARRELQLALDELNNRHIMGKLTSALSQGSPRGRVGDLDLSQVETDSLDHAIKYARTLGCKTVEASQLVATAFLVRQLRRALLDSDLHTARTLLDSVRGKVLAAAAAEEIQLVKYEVDNWLVVSELTAALSSGAPEGEVGQLDLGTIDTSALDVAIALTMKLGCHTVEARRCLLTALLIRRIRSALAAGDWGFLEQVLNEAKEEKHSIVPRAKKELQTAKDELELHAITNILRAAVKEVEEEGLIEGLTRASKLRLATHPEESVRGLVESSTVLLGRIQRAKTALENAIEAVRASDLVEAIALASSIKYTGSLVTMARNKLMRVQELTSQANEALKNMFRDSLESALQACEEEGLQLEVLDEIRAVLALGPEDFTRRQLSAAVANRDGPRVVELTMALKASFFADEQRLKEFELWKYPNLKPPHMFSRKFGVFVSGLENQMLKFQAEPIHSSLTLIESPSTRRTAVRLFRHILAFMGDKPLTKPISLASQLIGMCIDEPDLRDEVAVQLFKQLRENPTHDSVVRGWILLRLSLSAFPPSEDFENYVEAHLRSVASSGDAMKELIPALAESCIKAMHMSLYKGAAQRPPSEDEILSALSKARVPPPENPPSKMLAITNDSKHSEDAHSLSPPPPPKYLERKSGGEPAKPPAPPLWSKAPPDVGQPAPRGLLGDARRNGTSNGAAMPSFVSPVKPYSYH